MALSQLRTVAGVITGLVLFGAVTIRAAAPSVIMIYGGSLQKPVFIGPTLLVGQVSYDFLYGGSTSGIDKDLGSRPFFAVAMFWGGDMWNRVKADPAVLATLRPQDANQHGRLYPPSGGGPAIVVATPYMAGSSCARDADGRPVKGFGYPREIPADVKGFSCGWALSGAQVKIIRDLGIPGF